MVTEPRVLTDRDPGDEHDSDELAWVVDRFRSLGYPYPEACQLATHRVDWHAAERLLDAGATLEQAMRILL